MASHDVHDLSGTLGGCGKFQVILTACIHATTITGAFSILIMVFGMYNPGWRCADNDEIINVTHSYPNSHLKSSMQENSSHSTAWSLDCKVKQECENLMYNDDSSTVVTEWDLSCDLDEIPSIIVSIQMAGGLLGGYIGGQVADRYGRKFSLYANVALQGVCNLVAAFSNSWQMYATILFFIGFSANGIFGNVSPYLFEFIITWWRGIIVSLPLWNVCLLIFTLTVFLVRDWALVHIVTAVICVLAFLPVIWTPESIRWLTVSGKISKAKKVVTKISRINNKPCPDTDVIDEIARKEKARMGEHVYTILDLFRTAVLRDYSLKFGFLWITMSYTYYGISFGIRALSGDFYMNLLISSLSEIPILIFVAPMVNRLGRRFTILSLLFFEVTCCIILLAMSLLNSGTPDGMVVLIFASICKMLIGAKWNVVTLQSNELYPTVVRTIHYGYLVSLARIGAIISPYLIPNDPEKSYIAFVSIGVIGVISFVVIWTLPETGESILADITESTITKERTMVSDEEDC